MKLKLLVVSLALIALPLFGKSSEKEGKWSADKFSITVSDPHQDPYYGVITGNGGIGILPSREIGVTDRVVLNHVFDASGFHGMNVAIEGLNPFNLSYEVDGAKVCNDNVKDWSRTLDLRYGEETTRFTLPGKASFVTTIRALRGMPYCGLETVTVKALSDCRLDVGSRISVPEKLYGDTVCSVYKFKIRGKREPVVKVTAKTKGGSEKVSASSAFLSLPEGCEVNIEKGGEAGFSIALKKGSELTFSLIGSVCSTADFSDPGNESDREVTYCISEGQERLIDTHRKGWDELWQGDVIIEGDDEAQEAVRMSLYQLYASARKGSRLSIPPFGLTSTGYSGHIFWDTELWMYPPMLYLNPGIAESMMDYRIDRVDAASKRAHAYGYEGAMYPWESDRKGEEACPTWAMTGAFEHHISADIAIALWNYYCMTQDLDWLRDEGYPVMAKIADFWASRVSPNSDGTYSIRNVVCADEYAMGVDDNAFTNAAVSIALHNTAKAAEKLGRKAGAGWTDIAANLRIPKMSSGETAEYEGYDGARIKQADANLLGYPLGFITDEAQLRKDLQYYEPRINKKGPAMSYVVLAVQYSRMGDGEKAYQLFKRSFAPNQLPPFGVVSEGAGGTNPYFCTGAGGFLQAVINGFCGLELTEEGVVQKDSALPSHWKSVTVKGVGPEKKTYVRSR